jgi:predicted Ser/Thr protein kinase
VETAYRVSPLRSGDPARLGDYLLVGRLGAGGMGVVYLGQDTDGEYVAVKVVHAALASDPEYAARFRGEVRRAEQVPPFCTARFLHADLDHDPPYLVVEYIDGPSLAEVVAEGGPLEGGALHSLTVGIATALAGIHGAGVIHRDLKPGNVLLPAGSTKVIDFGLARPVEVTSQLTAVHTMVGTVSYMAPERLEGDGRPVTAAADVFAWGCVVTYAGTGHNPFEGDSPSVVASRILVGEPDLSGLPDPLAKVVSRALAKDPADRPTTQQLLGMLVGGVDATGTGSPPVSGGPVSGGPVPDAPVPSPPAGEDLRAPVPLAAGAGGEPRPAAPGSSGRHRRRWWALAAAAVAVLLITGIGVARYLDGNDAGTAPPAHPAAHGARLATTGPASPSPSASRAASPRSTSGGSEPQTGPSREAANPAGGQPTAAPNYGVPAGGTGTVRSVASAQCLDSDGNGSVYVNGQQGGNAFAGTCTTSASQRWREVSEGSGFYHLVDQQTGLCLDGDSSGNLYTTPCFDDDTNQRWQRLVAGHSGGYDLVAYRNGQTGRCAAMPSAGTLTGQTCSAGAVPATMQFTRR